MRHSIIGFAVGRPMRVAALIAVAACTLPDPTPLPMGSSRVVYFDGVVRHLPRFDIVFVVDSSPAMAGHAARVVASATDWINVLATMPGGLADLHLGVVTTDLGSDGVAEVVGCAGAGDGGVMRIADGMTRNFLADAPGPDGTRIQNYAGALGTQLTALVDVGTAGCAFPRPFEATRRALGHPANAGFLRDDAYLVIVFVTASDDCSFASPDLLAVASREAPCFTRPDALVPVADYVAALKGLKADPTDVIVLGVMGWAAPLELVAGSEGVEVVPSCVYEGAAAAPANRIQALLDEFPGRSSVTTICQTNLADGFAFYSVNPFGISDPCIYSALLDGEPATPGLQPVCSGELHSKADVVAMTPCADDAEAPACWSIIEEVECSPSGLRFAYRVPWSSASQHVILQCLVE